MEDGFQQLFGGFIVQSNPRKIGVRRSATEQRWNLGQYPAIETGPTRVLLAEDDNDMRQWLSIGLFQRGYDVVQAADGAHLGRWIARLLDPRFGSPLIDVVVADICMPGSTGLDGLQKLRRSDWSIPFLLMTAFGSDEVRAEANRLGAVTVLDKPFDLETLVRTLKNIGQVASPGKTYDRQ